MISSDHRLLRRDMAEGKSLPCVQKGELQVPLGRLKAKSISKKFFK